MQGIRPGYTIVLMVLTLNMASCLAQNFEGISVVRRNSDEADRMHLGSDKPISKRRTFTPGENPSLIVLQHSFVSRPYLTSQPGTSPVESASPEWTFVPSPSPTAFQSNSAPSSSSTTTTSATNGRDGMEGSAGIGTTFLGNNFFDMVPEIVGLPSTVATSPDIIGQSWNEKPAGSSPRDRFPKNNAQPTPITFVLPLTGVATTMPLPRPIANSAEVAMPFSAPSASITPSPSFSPTATLTSTPSPSATPSLSPSPTSTPSASPSQSSIPTMTPSPSSSTIVTETSSSVCVCSDICIDEYTRLYGGSCENGQCVDQITEDCRVTSGPLECFAEILTRGVCLNSQCVSEAYTCRTDACDAIGVYTVGYSSTGAGFRRQVGISEIQVTGCSTAFCQSSFAVQCDVQNAVGVCRKFGGAQCDVVNSA